jgi:hypothetical protein
VSAIAEVSTAMGRWHLKVRGVIVAVEADPCRDPRFPDVVWNLENLTEAANIINQRDAAAELARLDPVDPRD